MAQYRGLFFTFTPGEPKHYPAGRISWAGFSVLRFHWRLHLFASLSVIGRRAKVLKYSIHEKSRTWESVHKLNLGYKTVKTLWLLPMQWFHESKLVLRKLPGIEDAALPGTGLSRGRCSETLSHTFVVLVYLWSEHLSKPGGLELLPAS